MFEYLLELEHEFCLCLYMFARMYTHFIAQAYDDDCSGENECKTFAQASLN